MSDEGLYPFDPDWVLAPGLTLKEWAEENGNLEPAIIGAICRLKKETVEGIYEGTIPIDETMANHLAHGTQIPARMWLNLEKVYRNGLARGKSDMTRDDQP